MSHIFLVVHFSQMTQSQLETLQTENQHLKGLLQRKETHSSKVCLLWHSYYSVITLFYRQHQTGSLSWFGFGARFLISPQRGDSSLASLRESYVSSLSGLEQENQQLRQELAEMHMKPGCEDKYERALISHATEQPQNRYMANTQAQQVNKSNSDAIFILLCSNDDHKHRGEMQATQAKLQENTTCHEGEIQRLFKQLQTMSQPSTEQHSSSHSAASCSSSSSGSRRLTRNTSLPALSSNESAAEGQSSSSEDSRSLVPSPSPMVRLVNISTVLFFKPSISIISQCCVFFFSVSSPCQCPLQMSWCLVSWRKKACGPKSCSRDWTPTSRAWERTTSGRCQSTCLVAQGPSQGSSKVQ